MGYDLSVIISNACNSRCSFCAVDKDDRAELSFEQIDDIVAWSNQSEVETCVVFGGEPLLFFDKVKALCRVKCGMFLLLTNGTLLTEEVFDFLDENPQVSIAVAIDGPPKVHERQRGKYRFEKERFEKLKNWKACDFALTLDNLPNLIECVQWIHQACGFENIFVNLVRERPYSGEDIALFREQLQLVADYLVRLPVHFSLLESRRVDDGIFCDLGSKLVSVGSDGRVYLCHGIAAMERSLLDTDERKPRHGFDFSLRRENRRLVLGESINDFELTPYNYPERCRTCYAKSTCLSCPASFYLTGGNLDAIPAWFCDLMVVKDHVQRDYLERRAKLWDNEVFLPPIW
ncbi:MAG: radical SAM protein [Planctomycetes bacterium]|nr:radical SAM protein [Planctomycetota bacterium]